MAMKIKIGDRVAVIDDTVSGVVTAIDLQQITLRTEDDFLLTFDSADLVVIKDEQQEYSKFIDIQNEALIEKEPQVSSKVVGSTRKRKQPPLEVDLHIHQLAASTRGMTNHEMLTLQIETAKKRLEFAIRKKIHRVVFIHGVGEGVLKKELEFLLARYNVDVYPASFQKYGFGATEVYIYQNKP